MKFQRHLLGQRAQTLASLRGYGSVDLRFHLGGQGAEARGVSEDMHLRKADLFAKGEGLLKVLLGLAGKADNNIGGEGGVMKRGTSTLYCGKVFFGGIAPPHRLQNGIGTRLQRKMQMRHNPLRGRPHLQ